MPRFPIINPRFSKGRAWFASMLLPMVTALVLVAPLMAQETYKIDPSHSEISFKVRHLVSKMPWRFTKFDGLIKVSATDVTKSSVEVTIDAASINTDNEARDKHLRMADFFDTAKYPVITFKSTSVKDLGQGKLEIIGDLTMRGITKRISFPITSLGAAKDTWGATRGGWGDGVLTFKRQDFGISYGPGLIGDDVEIALNVEAVKQP